MSVTPHAMRMAEAAVTRLCHDVIGSVGAVLNGLELAADGGSLAPEALLLAAEAAREISARLRLARALWNVDCPLDTADLAQLADGLPNRQRLQLDVSDLAAGTLPPTDGRLLLAALTMAAEALHGRGTIVLSGDPAQAVVIVIAGHRAAWAEDLPSLLADPQSSWRQWEPRDLATPLALLLAELAGAELSLLSSAADSAGLAPLQLGFRR